MAKVKISDTLEIDGLNPGGDGKVPVSVTSGGRGVMLHVDAEFLKRAMDGLNGKDGGWQGSWFHARGGFGDGGHLAIGRIEDAECGDDLCRVILGDAQDEVSMTISAGRLLHLLDEAFSEIAILEADPRSPKIAKAAAGRRRSREIAGV